MKKKILIASFVAAIMLLLPMTAVAREANVTAQIAEEPNKEKIIIELTSEDITQSYNSFEYYLKDDPILYGKIKQAFDDAIIVDRDGSIKLDLEKYVDELKPALYELLPAMQQTMQIKGASYVPSTLNNNGVGEFSLSMAQQPLRKAIVNTGIDPDIDAIAKNRWNNLIRPILNIITEVTWPMWRTDTNDYDGDGPLLADEKSDKLDEPGIKYEYQGLDDSTDWDILAGLLYVLPFFALGVLICLVFFFLIYPLITVVLVGIEVTVFFQEAFDVKDLPYGSPSGPVDGK